MTAFPPALAQLLVDVVRMSLAQAPFHKLPRYRKLGGAYDISTPLHFATSVAPIFSLIEPPVWKSLVDFLRSRSLWPPLLLFSSPSVTSWSFASADMSNRVHRSLDKLHALCPHLVERTDKITLVVQALFGHSLDTNPSFEAARAVFGPAFDVGDYYNVHVAVLAAFLFDATPLYLSPTSVIDAVNGTCTYDDDSTGLLADIGY